MRGRIIKQHIFLLSFFLLVSGHISPAQALYLDRSALLDAGEPGTDYIPSVNFNLDAPLPQDRAAVRLSPQFPFSLASFSQAAQTAFNNDEPTQFKDWHFHLGRGIDLHGNLIVDQYQARRGTAVNEGVGNAAGAFFHAHYNRAVNDPAKLSLTWLQFFTDNTGPNGSLVSHIDPFPNDDGIKADGTVDPNKEKLPFYLRDNERGENLSDPFNDRPSSRITGVPFSRLVTFQLYLVGYSPSQVNDGTQGGDIVTYGGVQWGYTITVPAPAIATISVASIPEPSSGIVLASMLLLFLTWAFVKAPWLSRSTPR